MFGSLQPAQIIIQDLLIRYPYPIWTKAPKKSKSVVVFGTHTFHSSQVFFEVLLSPFDYFTPIVMMFSSLIGSFLQIAIICLSSLFLETGTTLPYHYYCIFNTMYREVHPCQVLLDEVIRSEQTSHVCPNVTYSIECNWHQFNFEAIWFMSSFFFTTNCQSNRWTSSFVQRQNTPTNQGRTIESNQKESEHCSS